MDEGSEFYFFFTFLCNPVLTSFDFRALKLPSVAATWKFMMQPPFALFAVTQRRTMASVLLVSLGRPTHFLLALGIALLNIGTCETAALEHSQSPEVIHKKFVA